MAYSDNELPERGDEFTEESDIQERIGLANSYLEKGSAILYSDFFEEVIEDCFAGGYFREALPLVNELIRNSPTDSHLWLQRGCLVAELGSFRKAMKAFNRVLKMQPNNAEALLEKIVTMIRYGYNEELDELLADLSLIDQDKETAYFRIASAFKSRANYDKAAEFFEKALTENPTNPDSWFQLALAYEHSHKLHLALASYDSYLEVEPECEVGWYNRGILLEHIGELEKAMLSYKKSITLVPDFSDAWFNLGNLYADMGRYNNAIKTFEKVISIDPKDSGGYFNLAMVYEEIGNYSTAIEKYSIAISLRPKYHTAYLNRGFCELMVGNMDAALSDFNLALATNIFPRGRWIKRTKRHSPDEQLLSSLRNLQKLTEASFCGSKEYITLGDMYLLLLNYERASECYKFASKKASKSSELAESFFLQAKTEFIQKNTEKALHLLITSFVLNEESKKRFEKEFPLVAVSKLFKVLIQPQN